MKTERLLNAIEFHNEHPYAQPLLVNKDVRILRFMLKPGQGIVEHKAPHSPFYIVILQGRGMFSGADGIEKEFGVNTLLSFDVAEVHSLRALNEPLIFLGFLQGVRS